MAEALNRVIRSENTQQVRSPAARFRERLERPPLSLIPLQDVKLKLDHDDERLMGLGLNNSPDGNEPHDDNLVDGGSTLSASPLTNKSVGGDDNDDASSTARFSTAAGSNATTASATALDQPVNGSDAPPSSNTTLDSPFDGSVAAREGDTLAAGATGDDDNPLGNGTGGDSSIPPMQQSAYFPIFCQENDRIGGLLVTASLEQNTTNVSDEVEDGSGAVRRASHPLAALAALASGGGIAAAVSSLLVAAVRLVSRTLIGKDVGVTASGGDTNLPMLRLLAEATCPPLSVQHLAGHCYGCQQPVGRGRAFGDAHLD